MKFSAADQAAMIDALGDDIQLDYEPYRGVYQAPGKESVMYDGGIITSGPGLTLSEAVAALVTENETIITISEDEFRATQKIPVGNGLVKLELTKDF